MKITAYLTGGPRDGEVHELSEAVEMLSLPKLKKPYAFSEGADPDAPLEVDFVEYRRNHPVAPAHVAAVDADAYVYHYAGPREENQPEREHNCTENVFPQHGLYYVSADGKEVMHLTGEYFDFHGLSQLEQHVLAAMMSYVQQLLDNERIKRDRERMGRDAPKA